MSLIANPIQNPHYIDFSEIQSEIPMMKNVVMGFASSPTCDEERKSNHFEYPIEFPIEYPVYNS
jgi:hypothetical protein